MIGTALAAATTAMGAGQKLAGFIKRKKAEKMGPALEDSRI